LSQPASSCIERQPVDRSIGFALHGQRGADDRLHADIAAPAAKAITP
jgi:hypothetical protein